MSDPLLFTYKDKRLIMDVSGYVRQNSTPRDDHIKNENVEVEDIHFLKDAKQKFSSVLGDILDSNNKDNTNELFVEVILSNDLIQNQYQQSITDECLKHVEEKVGVKMVYLQKKSASVNCEIITNLQYLCQKNQSTNNFSEVRVAVVGNVDAGKSTLLGVLSRDCLDDGRGSARLRVFRHQHEMESGRTSSVGTVLVGFDKDGKIVKRAHQSHTNKDRSNYRDVCMNSSKVVLFVDLAGHERYLKTTIFGLLGYYPDCVLLVVGANMGTIGMTQEHLNLSVSINLPTFIVVTKVDICPPDVLNATKKSISKLIRDTNRKAYLIRNESDAITAAINFNLRMCPVFLISSVTGESIDTLKVFMRLLIRKTSSSSCDQPPLLHIDEVYRVPGVGSVVGGFVKKGVISSGHSYLLGPFGPEGKFVLSTVKSVHRQRIPVDYGMAGQSISVALKNVKRSELRKGMVITCKTSNPVACLEFTARVSILHTSATISEKYCAMVHISTVRQTAKIITKDESRILKGGDDAIVTFRFMQRPEFVEVGSRLVFREGKMRGHGVVLSTTPIEHKNPK